MLALKKLLLKWALREWGTPDFQESAGKHGCRFNRVYDLRRKLDALKYK